MLKQVCFCLIFSLCALCIQAKEYPYQLQKKVDIPLLVIIGVASPLSILSFQKSIQRTNSPPQFKSLNNSLNRWTARQFLPLLSSVSDIGLITLGVAPLFVSGFFSPSSFWIELVMLSQSIALASSFNLGIRSLVKHPRPFVYNDDVSLEIRTSGEAQRGFYSGHASGAFLSAIFLNRQLKIYFPQSRWTPWLQTLSFVTASSVAGLRVASGKHFVEDVLIGAVIGSLFGLGIPYLHQTKTSWLVNAYTNSIQIHYLF